MRLYGDAKIKYGEIELEADEIIIDYDKATIYAQGREDSTGRRGGFPVFTNGPEQYETREITYNFKTKKARIKEVVTKQGEGLLHGAEVYKNERNEILSRHNAYTTCDLPDPHFKVISTKSKAIPGDKVVSGPFYMEFMHVPLPLVLPFGMFPSKIKATSGIIVPTYGEEGTRGFFLRGGGYYFNISDFIDLTVTGDVYSRGSNALNLNSRYKKRYSHNGTFNFAVTNNRFNKNIENKDVARDFRLTWSHSPETKGTGRFSASVNAATATYTNNNYLGVNTNPANFRPDNFTTKLSSNVSYSKTFPLAGVTLGINMRHSQDLQTKRVDLPLPDLSLNVNNLYPFRKIAKGIASLENVNIRITTVGTNQITNSLGLQPKITNGEEVVRDGRVVLVDSVADFNLSNFSTFLRNSKKGVKHTLPFGTSIKVLKFFTLSPSINFTETWYFDKLTWGLDSTRTKAIPTDTVRGFNRVSNYSLSIGMNTRLYGMLYFKGKKIQAIRHVVNPSISFSYQPDYTENENYFQKLYALKNPTIIPSRTNGPLAPQLQPSDFTELVVSRHQGYVYGESSRGRSSTMGFGINNSIEMKVKGEKDTLAKKVSILNSLSISSGYNFLARDFKLSPFSLSANTNVLDNKINLNVSATLDPYVYNLDSITEKTGRIYQTKIDQYVWQNKFSLGQLTSANFAFSTNLNPKGNEQDKDTQKKIVQSNLDESDKKALLQNADAYVDFSIPWNVRLNYNITYSKQGHLPSQIVQSLRINGDFSLSQKWKIQYNTGYDLQKKDFTQTDFSLTRDLHCWTLSLNWVPFGQFQSYNFFIGVKSSLLKDLKLNRTRSFFDLQR
jgi:LptD protein